MVTDRGPTIIQMQLYSQRVQCYIGLLMVKPPKPQSPASPRLYQWTVYTRVVIKYAHAWYKTLIYLLQEMMFLLAMRTTNCGPIHDTIITSSLYIYSYIAAHDWNRHWIVNQLANCSGSLTHRYLTKHWLAKYRVQAMSAPHRIARIYYELLILRN